MADEESTGQAPVKKELPPKEKEVIEVMAEEVISALVATIGKDNVPRAFAALRKGKKNLSDIISDILDEDEAGTARTASRYQNFVEPQQGTTDELDPTEVSSTKGRSHMQAAG